MGAGKDESDRTLVLDPGATQEPAGQAVPFVGSVAYSLLDGPDGAPVPMALGTVLWRAGGPLRLTLVAKASFSMLADPRMTPVEADAFRTSDAQHRNRPLGHVVAANDRVPWKASIDVTLLGHAYAPGGVAVPEGRARFSVRQGEKVALDKEVRVVGDRGTPDAAPAPFLRIPIVYERARGGHDAPANPIGCSEDDDQQPNVLDPGNPRRPAGFGPIPAVWPLRRQRLIDRSPAFLDAAVVEVPQGFDWSYFQSAPSDQLLSELAPDATLVLEGFHAERPRIEVALPGARAVGAVYGLDEASPDAPTALVFRADTLHVDADRWICTLAWRACVELRDATQLARLLVAVGVGVGGRDPAIPALRPQPTGQTAAPPGARAGAALISPTGTLELLGGEASPVSLPFGRRGAVVDPTLVLGDPTPVVSLPPGGDATPPAATVPAAAEPPRKASDLFHELPRPHDGEPGIAPLTFSPRTRDALRVVTRAPIVAFTLPWQIAPPRDARVVIIKATFDLVPDGPAKLRARPDQPSGDVHADDDPQRSLLYPSDFALWKPRADVVLKGHAFAPRVELRFGRGAGALARRIAVFGERTWVGGVPSEPKPFKRVALVWEHAFGGPDVASNPIGLGRVDRLPQLEAPGALVRSRDDRPEPVGFGAIPTTWPGRRARLGTYDQRWRKTRWPYFPEDFDWTYFQAAPPSQQLESIRGDEPFALVGMHPSLSTIEGTLPRLRARCFAQRTTIAGGAFEEIATKLDTVVIDVDELKLNLVWRGRAEVRDAEASDVAELFIFLEALAGPEATLAEARALFLAQRQPLQPVAEDPDAPATANDTPGKVAASVGLGAKRAARRAAARPDAVPPRRSLGAGRRAAAEKLAAKAPLDGLDLAGEDLTGLDFTGASLVGANLKEARLAGCHLAGAILTRAQMSRADLTDADLTGAALAQADLTGATIAGARFDGAALDGAVLADVKGERASFRAATGKRVSFARGVLKGARFDGAALDGADFTRAEIDEAVFDGARMPAIRLYDVRGTKVSFVGAKLDGARADRACLPRAVLRDVSAPGSVWDRAILDECTFADALLVGASFSRASCMRTVFSGAELSEAQLPNAALARASFLKANLMKAKLTGADLSGADLRGANLHGAELWKAKLAGADLELAITTRTKLGGGS